MSTFHERLTPSTTEWTAPERIPGGVDDTGKSMPNCRPEHHDDGKHSFMCMAGIWGWTQAEDGWWDRDPPHPLRLPGARWFYAGPAYVRPVSRGVSLEEGAMFGQLEDLPEGEYDIRVEFIRRESPA
jgi:hypothetical protein